MKHLTILVVLAVAACSGGAGQPPVETPSPEIDVAGIIDLVQIVQDRVAP